MWTGVGATDITCTCVLNALRGVYCIISGNYLDTGSPLDYKEGREHTVSQVIFVKVGTDVLPEGSYWDRRPATRSLLTLNT